MKWQKRAAGGFRWKGWISPRREINSSHLAWIYHRKMSIWSNWIWFCHFDLCNFFLLKPDSRTRCHILNLSNPQLKNTPSLNKICLLFHILNILQKCWAFCRKYGTFKIKLVNIVNKNLKTSNFWNCILYIGNNLKVFTQITWNWDSTKILEFCIL